VTVTKLLPLPHHESGLHSANRLKSSGMNKPLLALPHKVYGHRKGPESAATRQVLKGAEIGSIKSCLTNRPLDLRRA